MNNNQKKKNDNILLPAEQKTTAAFKLKSAEIKSLKQSLRKIQDQMESVRQEKFELEKTNAILQNKQDSIFWIECFRFIAAVGVGFATNYFFSNNTHLAITLGIPSVIIFIIATIANKK